MAVGRKPFKRGSKVSVRDPDGQPGVCGGLRVAAPFSRTGRIPEPVIAPLISIDRHMQRYVRHISRITGVDLYGSRGRHGCIIPFARLLALRSGLRLSFPAVVHQRHAKQATNPDAADRAADRQERDDRRDAPVPTGRFFRRGRRPGYRPIRHARQHQDSRTMAGRGVETRDTGPGKGRLAGGGCPGVLQHGDETRRGRYRKRLSVNEYL